MTGKMAEEDVDRPSLDGQGGALYLLPPATVVDTVSPLHY